MGRYYNGTISGKFWFGIQNSHDAANFKDPLTFILPIEYLTYHSCCCDVDNTCNLYCIDCFSSYDEHYNSLDDYDKDLIEINGIIFTDWDEIYDEKLNKVLDNDFIPVLNPNFIHKFL